MIILKGNKAKEYFNKVLDNEENIKEFRNLEGFEDVIGGYWKEYHNNIWVAFDANCDFTIEEFDKESEALLYAVGKEALTRYGYKI